MCEMGLSPHVLMATIFCVSVAPKSLKQIGHETYIVKALVWSTLLNRG